MSVIGYDFKCLKCGRVIRRLDEGNFIYEPIRVSIFKCKQCNHLYSMFSDHWLNCPQCGSSDVEKWNHCCPNCGTIMQSVFLYRDSV